jgi:hypothetical protein
MLPHVVLQLVYGCGLAGMVAVGSLLLQGTAGAAGQSLVGWAPFDNGLNDAAAM